MHRRHGVIGGPKQKPPRQKQPIKPKSEFIDSTKSTDKVQVVVVFNKDHNMVREFLNPEIDYNSIEDDGPISIEDMIYITTMEESTLDLYKSISNALDKEDTSNNKSIIKKKVVSKKKKRKKKAKK